MRSDDQDVSMCLQMEGAHLALLGGFCLRDPAGREIAIGSRKAQALLAVLGVAFPGSVGRERLIGILWGEHSQERARHSLRQTISELRRDVPLLIVVHGDALALDASCLHGGCRRVPGVARRLTMSHHSTARRCCMAARWPMASSSGKRPSKTGCAPKERNWPGWRGTRWPVWRAGVPSPAITSPAWRRCSAGWRWTRPARMPTAG